MEEAVISSIQLHHTNTPDDAAAKLLLTTVALSMAVTPLLDEAGNMISERIENKYGFSHYVGADAEGKAIKDTQSDFVVRGV